MNNVETGTALDDLFWEYKGLIHTMSSVPGMYHLDDMRRHLHKKINKFFKDKEKLKSVLHDLDKIDTPVGLVHAVTGNYNEWYCELTKPEE
jgi:hypothetical protein